MQLTIAWLFWERNCSKFNFFWENSKTLRSSENSGPVLRSDDKVALLFCLNFDFLGVSYCGKYGKYRSMFTLRSQYFYRWHIFVTTVSGQQFGVSLISVVIDFVEIFLKRFKLIVQLFAFRRFEFNVQKYFSTRCETQSIQFNRSSAEVNFSSFLFQAPLNNETCSNHKFLKTQTRSRSLIELYVFDHIVFFEKIFRSPEIHYTVQKHIWLVFMSEKW